MRIIIGTLGCAIAVIVAAPAADVRSVGHAALELSAAKKRHPARRARPAEGQIACTVAGCQRIPPQCHPEMGYTPSGIPTGFDVVVYPR